MSRRVATIEEFDDDTDIPLPSRPLPNKGAQGAILRDLEDSDEEDDDDEAPSLVEPSSSNPTSPYNAQFKPPDRPQNTITDITPYKKWTCIYPIYIDAKRPYGSGQRRISRPKSVWWPLSKDIADATNRLGLGTLHEVSKSHPRDWDNPGRVRVQWKRDGKLANPNIKTKKQLLEAIAFQIHGLKPELAPKPPYDFSPAAHVVSAPTPTPAPASKSTNTKGKQPAGKSSAQPSSSTVAPSSPVRQRLPIPPSPEPALASRFSPYSPAVPTGVLIETVKAGMNVQQDGAVPGLPGAGAQGAQKGKRKVVRVRG